VTTPAGPIEVTDGWVERHNFIDQLDPETAALLLASGRRQGFPARTILFHEHDAAADVHVIVEGAVKVAIVLASREIVLDVLDAGELLGELSAIEDRPRSADATTLTAVEVVTIPTAVFVDFLAEHPSASLALLRYISSRLREASQRQVEYGALDAIGRVCRRLVEMIDRYGRPSGTEVVMDLHLSQHDMAAWAGLSREAVVKALRSMRTLGWIRTEDRSITVVDERAIRTRAETELR
jgi:CRP/FNR family cyclic AMP-dependent transcriptional regulator